VDIGAHLPLIDFGDGPPTAADLTSYARACVDLGYAAMAANDHLVFPRPWLDGLTALAAVAGSAGTLTLATTVALPLVRGPALLAKALATLDVLSDGRVLAGVGPGSSPLDHAAVGLDFDERWRRLDEAVPTMRALWRGETYDGRFYSTRGTTMTPEPSRPGGPPIWLGSWGSPAGLRRVADLADGWLASGYHTTPAAFAAARSRLADELTAGGRDAGDFPNAVATFFFHITPSRAVADELVTDVLAPTLTRDPALLADRLAIGPAELLVERLTALHEAGAQRVYLWPLRDRLAQLELARAAWPV
jgi:alkanesulfonate monooxygenase SsuD/methylene tetrahydromethanopterin reductase-like flavin-dependent oxidoreductase (luciferase family)